MTTVSSKTEDELRRLIQEQKKEFEIQKKEFEIQKKQIKALHKNATSSQRLEELLEKVPTLSIRCRASFYDGRYSCTFPFGSNQRKDCWGSTNTW
jgi:hypothetical protein